MARRAQKPDRGYAKIAQDLCAKADLTPLPAARLFRGSVGFAWQRRDGHAGGAVAQKHNHAAAGVFEALQRGVYWTRCAKHIVDQVGTVQTAGNIPAVS